MDLRKQEQELKRRWAYPYRWRRVQNNRFDAATRFVYKCLTFERVLSEIEKRFANAPNPQEYQDYALNRWYNFRAAQAVEAIFASSPRVTPARNRFDRMVDFTLGGVPFDHKTTVFPRGFGRDLSYALNHPRELIRWLYLNQSQQQRKHYANRLFVVLYAADGQHWKLKAELLWLQKIIRDYVRTFEPATLPRFEFVPGKKTLADVIWAVSCF